MYADMKINHPRVTAYHFWFSTTSVGSGPASPGLEQMLLLEQMQRDLQSLQRRKLGTAESPPNKSSKEMGKENCYTNKSKFSPQSSSVVAGRILTSQGIVLQSSL